jgi:hypothetical protein
LLTFVGCTLRRILAIWGELLGWFEEEKFMFSWELIFLNVVDFLCWIWSGICKWIFGRFLRKWNFYGLPICNEFLEALNLFV